MERTRRMERTPPKTPAEKKAQQLACIPAEWKLSEEESLATMEPTTDLRSIAWNFCTRIMTQRELQIPSLDSDATTLVSKIAEGTYTAVEVTTAYCKRAAIAQQTSNCLTEMMFLNAIEEAKYLDETLRSTGRTVGPLHGLPVTFKDCFRIQGYDASDGSDYHIFFPMHKNSYLVDAVRAAGAIIIGKTNTPQLLLVGGCPNNVCGPVRDPVVSDLTYGGSSGGEGAILALGGSALAIGNDIGGSIRIPAAANGMYGYRPSFGVLPMCTEEAHSDMNTGKSALCGLMGRSVRDLDLLTSVVRAVERRARREDGTVKPLVYEQNLAARHPKVGVVYNTGLMPGPPVTQAIKEATERLLADGFEVVELSPHNFEGAREVPVGLLTNTPEEMSALDLNITVLPENLLDTCNVGGIDVILCPVAPQTIVLPGTERLVSDKRAPDYPAVIVPVPMANPARDHEENMGLLSPPNDDHLDAQSLYHPNLMADTPVCVQLVGRRLGDRQLLKDAELIDQSLKDQDPVRMSPLL